MTRSIIVDISDLHGGHRYGLLNPNTVLEEIDETGNPIGEYHPELHKIQSYLWDIYTKVIEAVKRLAGEDDIIVVFNGDMTAGNKHKALLVSDRMRTRS